MSILQMSISAGVLVIAIVLIRAVALNRLPKKMFLVLWSVALVRLLIPISIPLPFNVPNIISIFSKTVLPETAEPLVIDYSQYISVPATGITEAPRTAEQIPETTQKWIFNIPPTTVIWLMGMLAILIFFAVIYYKNHKGLHYATIIRDNDYLNEWLTEHKLTRPITIMQSDRIKTALAVGTIKPRIILPKSMDMNDQQLLDYVLTHEYYHIKRYDAFWKILLVLASCVHWFNPLVWIMFILVNRDLELTCDEMVIRRFGAETKTAYAYTLIGMAEQRSKFTPIYNGFSRNATEERIESIMKIKKIPLIGVLTSFALVSLLIMSVLLMSAGINTISAASDKPDFDSDKIKESLSGFSNSDTQDGITVSIESVYGGNETVFVKLKVETDDIIFNDNFEYSFGLWGINFSLNPADSGKNLINGGGTSKEVDKELWTEHIRYYDIKMSVMHGQWIDFDERAAFSLGDGQERLMVFEFFGYNNENYEWVKVSESEWKLKFSYDTDDRDIGNIDVIFTPFIFYGKGLMGDERIAQMTAIRLNKFSLECRYTVYEIQEALDFSADIILKDSTKITLIKGSSACGINMEGFMTFKTASAIDLNEVAYIQIGDEIIDINN